MRRTTVYLGLLALAVAGCGAGADARGRDGSATVAVAVDSAPAPSSPEAARAVAITIDDLPTASLARDTVTQWAITRGILDVLRRADAPAIGFVNEDKLGAGSAREARVRMLRAWLDAGHDLGNHGYAHLDINDTPLGEYTADIVRGEPVTTQLRGARPRYFRHPFLHVGNDAAKKAGLEAFLAERGYVAAPVTVDNYDYVFARAYELALDAGAAERATQVADAYVVYMDTVFGFYEAQSRAIVGREIPQVLLLHASRLNADRLDALLALVRRRGYRVVTLEEALRDSVYARASTYAGPAGMTWLHRWAITADLERSIFRGEPEVPAFVAEAAR